MPSCCPCNGNGKCKNCLCVKAHRFCDSCALQRTSGFHNQAPSSCSSVSSRSGPWPAPPPQASGPISSSCPMTTAAQRHQQDRPHPRLSSSKPASGPYSSGNDHLSLQPSGNDSVSNSAPAGCLSKHSSYSSAVTKGSTRPLTSARVDSESHDNGQTTANKRHRHRRAERQAVQHLSHPRQNKIP